MKPPQQVYLESIPSNTVLQRYSYVEALQFATPSMVSQWKTINPNLKVYYYRNFEQVYTESSEYAYFRDNNMLLKNSLGGLVYNKDYPTTDVYVDMGHPLYKTWMRNWIQTNVVGKSYDGVFCDNFVRPTYSGYDVRGVNPRKGAPYTDADWFTDSLAVLKEVKITGVKTVCNGIPQGDGSYGYWTNKTRCDQIIAVTDGLLIEGPIGWSLSDFNSRTPDKWKQNIDMLKIMVDSGKQVWFSNGGDSAMETDSIALYVFCSYMLNPPNSKYCVKFRGDTYMSKPYWTSLVNTDLGTVQENMVQEGQEYVRRYSGGEVRANPTMRTAKLIVSTIPPDNGGNPVSVPIKNEKTTTVTVIVRKTVVTETPTVINAGETKNIAFDASKDVLVLQ